MPRWAVLKKFTLVIMVAMLASIVSAQGTDPVKVIIDPVTDTIVVNETAFETVIKLEGDSSSCPVHPNQQPVDAVLVIDTSSSMQGEPIDRAKEAAGIFVKTLLKDSASKNSNRIGLVTFSTDARELIALPAIKSLPQNEGELTTAITGFTADGGTSIAAGLQQAAATVNANTQDTQNTDAVKVIVLLSDGQDDVETVKNAAAFVRGGNVRLVTIALGGEADGELLKEIASTPSDFHLVPDAAQLPAIFREVAEIIQPVIAAHDAVITYQVDTSQFELLPDTITPPPSNVDAKTGRITWVLSRLNNRQQHEFTFQAHARQVGTNIQVGSLAGSNYLLCEGDQRRSFDGQGPFVNVLLATPTPIPTLTPTPRPTDTPTPPSTATQIAAISDQIIPAQSTSTITQNLGFCADGFWSLLPLLLAILIFILFLLWAWWRYRRMLAGKCSRLCFVMWTLFGAYAAFVIWLFLLPPVSGLCTPRESVYFWRQNPEGVAGVYVTSQPVSDSTAFNAINSNGCVGCHTVSSTAGLVAGIQGPPPGRLLMYHFDGTPMNIPAVNANFISFSPDGRRVVIGDGNADLQIVDLQSGSITPLQGANNPGIAETMPSWGPNGRIAFARAVDMSGVQYAGVNITSPVDIYTIPETGGTAEPLDGASGSGFNYYPAYSPDGRWLAFTRHNDVQTYGDEQAEIWLVPASGGTAKRLAANDAPDGSPITNAGNSWPSWSRDSTQLAFNSRRSDPKFDIYFTAIDSNGNAGPAQVLGSAAQRNVFEHTPFWGLPPNRIDVLAQMLALWPFLLPLIPLAMLAWVSCRTRTTEEPEPIEVPNPTKLPPPPIPQPLKLPPLPPLWDPQPTLVIGLGESGRYTLTYLKKSLMDSRLGEMPDRIRLLCVDTGDYEQLRQQTSPITFAGVSLNETETVELKDNLEPLLRKNEFDGDPQFRVWLEDNIEALKSLGGQRLDLSQGAKGQRLLARLGLLYHLRTARPNLFEQLKSAAAACVTDNQRLNIVIVGDTFGDIASAVVFDIALLAREAGRSSNAKGINITTHLITDRAIRNFSKNREQDQANTGATLREIERFQLAQARPFPIYYPDIVSKVCDWLPVDEFMLYDGTGMDTTPPEQGIYPALADTITLWMDKAARQGTVRSLQEDQFTAMGQWQNTNYEVQVFSQGVFSYRLPFADLLEAIRYRFAQDLVRWLLMGRSNNAKIQSDPSLNVESYVSGDNKPESLARAFLTGKLGVQTKTPPPAMSMVTLSALLEKRNSSEAIRSLRQLDKDGDLTKAWSERLRATLQLLLNGREDSDIFTARGGKIGSALAFLENLKDTARNGSQALNTIQDATNARDQLKAALETLISTAAAYQDSLTKQAEALGLINDRKGALLQTVTQRSVDLDQRKQQMDAIKPRSYIWETETEEGLTRLDGYWYKKHIANPSADKREDALRQFYWQVGEDNSISLMLVGADDGGSKDSTLLDPNAISTFETALLDIVNRYCSTIQSSETFAAALAKSLLSEDYIQSSKDKLFSQSKPPLSYRSEIANVAQMHLLLAANPTIDTSELKSRLTRELANADNLIALPSTDPYTLSLVQRAAIVPLAAITTLTEARDYYRLNHGLSDNPKAVRRADPILTAVFEAEAVALELETQLKSLRLSRNLLHPLIVTALTDSRRAKVFALALASGDLFTQRQRDQQRDLLMLSTPDGDEIAFPSARDARLHPLSEGLLTFIRDDKTFPDELVTSLLKRYDTDADLPDTWKRWIDGAWEVWMEVVKDSDERNKEIMMDLLKLSRLYANRYRSH